MRQNFLLFYFSRLKMLSGSALLTFLSIFPLYQSAHAQQSSLVCNTQSNWIPSTFGGATAAEAGLSATPGTTDGKSGSGWTNTDNIVDNSTSTGGTLTLISYRTGACTSVHDATGSIKIRDNDGYSTGNFVGFVSAGSNPNNFTLVMKPLNADGTEISGASFTPNVYDYGSGTYLVGFVNTNASTFYGFKLEVTLEARTYLQCLALGDRTETLEIKNALQVKYCLPTDAACNTAIKLNQPEYKTTQTNSGGFELAGIPFGVNDADNAISPNTGDFATLTVIAAQLVDMWLQVKDNGATHPAGSFAGFEIENTALVNVGLFDGIEIETSLNGLHKETKSGAALLLSGSLVNSSGKRTVGFTTTDVNGFNEIKITVKGAKLGVSQTKVYNAVFKRFCEATTPLACNTKTYLTSPTYPVIAEGLNSGVLNVSVGSATIENLDRLVDASTSNYATIAPLANFNGKVTLSVKKELADFTSGQFIGFDFETVSLVSADVLGAISITTHSNGGAALQTVSGANLVSVSSSALSGTGRRQVGFVTTSDFDEVRFTVDYGLLAGLQAIHVYGAVIQKFCIIPENALVCNTITTVSNPKHPVYVNGKHTGVSATACVGCSINNSEFAVDNDLSNSAEIVIGASALGEASFAVSNALETYGEKSFAGFDIETNALLTASVLATAKVELLDANGVVIPSSSNNAILTVGSALVSGTANRQIIGVVAKAGVTYKGVKITFTQTLGANLGTIKIFGAVFSKLCAGTVECNTLYNLHLASVPAVANEQTFPVVINAERTGTSGVASVLESVNNPWAVVSAAQDDYATITNVAQVGAKTSISVENPIDTYPAGAMAGFTVKKSTALLNLGLLSYVTVDTYNDGVLQESSQNSSLLDLTILLFGSTTDYYNLGFRTTKPFDEIRLSLGSLVNATIQSIQVYGAFVDTRTAAGGALLCFNTNPDNNVTNKGVSVSGNLKTNDSVAPGTEYKNPTADANQPNPNNTDLPVIATDGSYTFVTNTPGIYSFNVDVCVPGQATCFSEALTITVLDKNITNNPPVANDDVAIVKGSATTPVAVIVDVTANDGPGNPGGTLGNPTIPNLPSPSIGTAVIENGKIKFTPVAGVYGEVTIVYQVCETPTTPQSCTTAKLVVTVLRPEAPNTLTASDDYASAFMNTTLTVSAADGVLINDSDPDGNTLSAIAQSNVVIASVGTFNLSTDGSYTFSPVSGYTGPASLVYQAFDGTNTSTATLYVLVAAGVVTNPDNNVAYKNVSISGNVSTNDGDPASYKYGLAVANGTNPSADIPVVAQDGSYTFVTATPGIYSFLVPVCLGSLAPGCATEKLTITVLDPSIATNPPVANDDIVTIKGSATTPVPVLVNVTVNDGVGNLGSVLESPTISIAPAHGTATIVGGKVQYTPNAGFYGKDIVTYQVCETPTHANACTTAELVVTVLDPGAPNTLSASDDYASTGMNATLTVNASNGVLANDYDPDGNTLTVTAQNTTIPSVGGLALATDGSYTFTPVAGYVGPAEFVYTVCDGVSGCKKATLYIFVKATPDFSPIIDSRGTMNTGESKDAAITIYNGGKAASTGSVQFAIFKLTPQFEITFNPLATSVTVISSVAVENEKWTVSDDGGYYLFTLKPGNSIPANGTAVIGVTVKAIGISHSTGTLNAAILGGTGPGDQPTTNNDSFFLYSIN